MSKKLCLAAVVLALPGCATIVDGRPDNVSVVTSDGSRAQVRVDTASGQQTIFTPGVVTLEKSCRDVLVSVVENDEAGQSAAVIHSNLNPWIIGNIVFGGVPGIAVDAVTGALCTYDKRVVIPVVRNR